MTFQRGISRSSDTPLAYIGAPQLLHDEPAPVGAPLGAVVHPPGDPAGIEGVDAEEHRPAAGVAQQSVTVR